jgi:hypothetical protein
LVPGRREKEMPSDLGIGGRVKGWLENALKV